MKTALPLVIGSFLFAILSAACSSSVETTSTGGGGNGTSSGNGGTGGTVCVFEAPPCCAESPNDPCCAECLPTSKVCGGLGGTPCAADEYCDFPNDDCGGDDGLGVCVKKPLGCSDIYAPVCACDGKVYSNQCDANSIGLDVSTLGGCTPPQGEFGCGPFFCTLGEEYCEKIISDVGGEPSTYSCQPLPASCNGVTDCGCLTNVPCAPSCQATSNGGAQITCPGG